MGGGRLSYGFFLPPKPEPGRFYHFMCPLVFHYYYYKVHNSSDIIKDFNIDLYIYLVFLVCMVNVTKERERIIKVLIDTTYLYIYIYLYIIYYVYIYMLYSITYNSYEK